MTETTNKPNSRRNFLVKFSTGASVMIGMSLVGCNPMRRVLFDNTDALVGADYGLKEGAFTWFEITAENQILLHSPKVEMGQGVFTGLSQIAAEELEVDLDQITIVHASTAGRPVDPRSTGGSDTISGLWNPLRELAAKTRVMLTNNAAALLGVSASEVTLKNATASAKGKTLTFGEIVQQSTTWEEPKEVTLKPINKFKVIGKALPRVDLMPKIKGDPIFGIDVHLPGMLYGLVLRPPLIDTEYMGADASAAQGMPGVVQIVKEDDFVAVVAKSRAEAERAARAVKVEWKTNKYWEHEEILAMTKVGAGEDFLIQKEGSAMEGDDLLAVEYSTTAGAH
ncbi:MAG TPA: xanthine dehydrogenase, partial [Cytophagales bacterium]|nr:xanthine dehydrogenase [Cytophagales bacterium]